MFQSVEIHFISKLHPSSFKFCNTNSCTVSYIIHTIKNILQIVINIISELKYETDEATLFEQTIISNHII